MGTKTINSLGGSCAYILNRLVDSWQLAIGELYFTHTNINPGWAGKIMEVMILLWVVLVLPMVFTAQELIHIDGGTPSERIKVSIMAMLIMSLPFIYFIF